MSSHGNQIGSTLLQHAETLLKKINVSELYVETIVEQSPPDGSYDKTITFYLKHKFEIHIKNSEESYNEFRFRKGILIKKLV